MQEILLSLKLKQNSMSKIALFTVFYPGAETYVDEFFNSVLNQTYKNFDLIIVNDGYKDDNLASHSPNLNIIELRGDATISGNRAIGINYAIDNAYDYLFLCDVDDYMYPTRVEHVLESFGNNDIIVNDLDIVDADRKLIVKDYFQKTISANTILDKDFIKDKNIFGFSNSALKISAFSKVSFPADLKVVDWYFFTQLLNEGLKAQFLDESLTEYRQHSGNMIGISSFTIDVFKKLIDLKKKQYSYIKEVYPVYQKLYDQMLNLSKLPDNELQKIIDKNTDITPYPVWWENVKF